MCLQRYRIVYRLPEGTPAGSAGVLSQVDVYQSVVVHGSDAPVPFHQHDVPRQSGTVRALAVDVREALVRERRGAGNCTPQVGASHSAQRTDLPLARSLIVHVSQAFRYKLQRDHALELTAGASTDTGSAQWPPRFATSQVRFFRL
jgi:hypothetical protein